jgi:hypothetical protein
MGKTWVLHTETKGTGANVVPLERVRKAPARPEPVRVPRKPRPKPPVEPTPRPPHRFRVLDVVTRQTLVDDANTADTVAALADVRSIVDVNIYVWQDESERWRMLTLDEQRAMFDLATK